MSNKICLGLILLMSLLVQSGSAGASRNKSEDESAPQRAESIAEAKSGKIGEAKRLLYVIAILSIIWFCYKKDMRRRHAASAINQNEDNSIDSNRSRDRPGSPDEESIDSQPEVALYIENT